MRLMMVEQKPEGSNEEPAIREEQGKKTGTFGAHHFYSRSSDHVKLDINHTNLIL